MKDVDIDMFPFLLDPLEIGNVRMQAQMRQIYYLAKFNFLLTIKL